MIRDAQPSKVAALNPATLLGSLLGAVLAVLRLPLLPVGLLLGAAMCLRDLMHAVPQPKPCRRSRLLLWLHDQLGAALDAEMQGGDAVGAVWLDGSLLCVLAQRTAGARCPHARHPHGHVAALKHGFRMVKTHIGVPSGFSDQELEVPSLTTLMEKRFVRYIWAVRRAVLKRSVRQADWVQEARDANTTSDSSAGSEAAGNPTPRTSRTGSRCIARGVGLFMATRGEPAHFFVYVSTFSVPEVRVEITGPANSYGCIGVTLPLTHVQQPDSNLPPQVQLAIPAEFRVSINKMEVSYTPVVVGPHKIHVLHNGSHVVGSPFSALVTEPKPPSSQCNGRRLSDTPISKTSPRRRSTSRRRKIRVIYRIVDFVKEKMLLTDDGRLERLPDAIVTQDTSPPRVYIHYPHPGRARKRCKRLSRRFKDVVDRVRERHANQPSGSCTPANTSSEEEEEGVPVMEARLITMNADKQLQSRCLRILRTCSLILKHFPKSQSLHIMRTADHIINTGSFLTRHSWNEDYARTANDDNRKGITEAAHLLSSSQDANKENVAVKVAASCLEAGDAITAIAAGRQSQSAVSGREDDANIDETFLTERVSETTSMIQVKSSHSDSKAKLLHSTCVKEDFGREISSAHTSASHEEVSLPMVAETLCSGQAIAFRVEAAHKNQAENVAPRSEILSFQEEKNLDSSLKSELKRRTTESNDADGAMKSAPSPEVVQSSTTQSMDLSLLTLSTDKNLLSHSIVTTGLMQNSALDTGDVEFNVAGIQETTSEVTSNTTSEPRLNISSSPKNVSRSASEESSITNKLDTQSEEIDSTGNIHSHPLTSGKLSRDTVDELNTTANTQSFLILASDEVRPFHSVNTSPSAAAGELSAGEDNATANTVSGLHIPALANEVRQLLDSGFPQMSKEDVHAADQEVAEITGLFHDTLDVQVPEQLLAGTSMSVESSQDVTDASASETEVSSGSVKLDGKETNVEHTEENSDTSSLYLPDESAEITQYAETTERKANTKLKDTALDEKLDITFKAWPSRSVFGESSVQVSDMDVDFEPIISAPDIDEALRQLDMSIQKARSERMNGNSTLFPQTPAYITSESSSGQSLNDIFTETALCSARSSAGGYVENTAIITTSEMLAAVEEDTEELNLCDVEEVNIRIDSPRRSLSPYMSIIHEENEEPPDSFATASEATQHSVESEEINLGAQHVAFQLPQSHETIQNMSPSLTQEVSFLDDYEHVSEEKEEPAPTSCMQEVPDLIESSSSSQGVKLPTPEPEFTAGSHSLLSSSPVQFSETGASGLISPENQYPGDYYAFESRRTQISPPFDNLQSFPIETKTTNECDTLSCVHKRSTEVSETDLGQKRRQRSKVKDMIRAYESLDSGQEPTENVEVIYADPVSEPLRSTALVMSVEKQRVAATQSCSNILDISSEPKVAEDSLSVLKNLLKVFGGQEAANSTQPLSQNACLAKEQELLTYASDKPLTPLKSEITASPLVSPDSDLDVEYQFEKLLRIDGAETVNNENLSSALCEQSPDPTQRATLLHNPYLEGALQSSPHQERRRLLVRSVSDDTDLVKNEEDSAVKETDGILECRFLTDGTSLNTANQLSHFPENDKLSSPQSKQGRISPPDGYVENALETFSTEPLSFETTCDAGVGTDETGIKKGGSPLLSISISPLNDYSESFQRLSDPFTANDPWNISVHTPCKEMGEGVSEDTVGNLSKVSEALENTLEGIEVAEFGRQGYHEDSSMESKESTPRNLLDTRETDDMLHALHESVKETNREHDCSIETFKKPTGLETLYIPVDSHSPAHFSDSNIVQRRHSVTSPSIKIIDQDDLLVVTQTGDTTTIRLIETSSPLMDTNGFYVGGLSVTLDPGGPGGSVESLDSPDQRPVPPARSPRRKHLKTKPQSPPQGHLSTQGSYSEAGHQGEREVDDTSSLNETRTDDGEESSSKIVASHHPEETKSPIKSGTPTVRELAEDSSSGNSEAPSVYRSIEDISEKTLSVPEVAEDSPSPDLDSQEITTKISEEGFPLSMRVTHRKLFWDNQVKRLTDESEPTTAGSSRTGSPARRVAGEIGELGLVQLRRKSIESVPRVPSFSSNKPKKSKKSSESSTAAIRRRFESEERSRIVQDSRSRSGIVHSSRRFFEKLDTRSDNPSTALAVDPVQRIKREIQSIEERTMKETAVPRASSKRRAPSPPKKSSVASKPSSTASTLRTSTSKTTIPAFLQEKTTLPISETKREVQVTLEEHKDRFQQAKSYFRRLEEPGSNQSKPPHAPPPPLLSPALHIEAPLEAPQEVHSDSGGHSRSGKIAKVAERFNVKDVFQDVLGSGRTTSGLKGLKGTPHRKAVLAALSAMDNPGDTSPYDSVAGGAGDEEDEDAPPPYAPPPPPPEYPRPHLVPRRDLLDMDL